MATMIFEVSPRVLMIVGVVVGAGSASRSRMVWEVAPVMVAWMVTWSLCRL